MRKKDKINEAKMLCSILPNYFEKLISIKIEVNLTCYLMYEFHMEKLTNGVWSMDETTKFFHFSVRVQI